MLSRFQLKSSELSSSELESLELHLSSVNVFDYEQFKNSFLDTAAQCASEGMAFIPMVVEAHSGAWGPAAAKIWLRLGKAVSLVSGESTAVEALRALQNLGLTLHRETARAILRRSPVRVGTVSGDAARALLHGSEPS